MAVQETDWLYLVVVGMRFLNVNCRAFGTMTGGALMTGPSNIVSQWEVWHTW